MVYDATEGRALEDLLDAPRDPSSNNTQTGATHTAGIAKVTTTPAAAALAPRTTPIDTRTAPGSNIYDSSELRAIEQLVPAKPENMGHTSEEGGGNKDATG